MAKSSYYSKLRFIICGHWFMYQEPSQGKESNSCHVFEEFVCQIIMIVRVELASYPGSRLG